MCEMIEVMYLGPSGGVRSRWGTSPTAAGSPERTSWDELPRESVELERSSASEAIECRVAALDRRVLAIPHPGVERKPKRGMVA